VKLDGENWKLGDPTFSVQHGFIYLPEERKKQGILPVLSIRENISMAVLDDMKGPLGISGRKEEELAQKVISTYDVKTPDADKEIQFLSGGNQQKVIIGRAMCCNPKVMVFDEPTKGIDVGTKAEIQKLILKLAGEGKSILFISSEISEMLRTCSRMAIMRDGEKVGELDHDLTQENVMKAIAGGEQEA
jgi:ribose transport system ATP-binding protein